MKEFFILYLKGIIIGIGKIVPGVSGALIAMSLNLYERCLLSITNFFNNVKENLKLLIPIGLGIVTSIILISNVLNYLLKHYYFYTILIIINLIIINIFPIIKKETNKQNLLYIIIPLLLNLMLFINLNLTHNNIYYYEIIFCGIIDAISTIIPGISGTSILIMLGYYQAIIDAISNININFLIIYFSSMFITIIILTKIVEYLLKNQRQKTFGIIIGFSISSIITLIITISKYITSIKEIIFILILILINIIIKKIIDH